RSSGHIKAVCWFMFTPSTVFPKRRWQTITPKRLARTRAPRSRWSGRGVYGTSTRLIGWGEFMRDGDAALVLKNLLLDGLAAVPIERIFDRRDRHARIFLLRD